jgi:glucokinase
MIGFDIGGTKCAVLIGEEKNGEIVILDKRKIDTDHNVSAYEMIDRMCALAEEMTDDFSKIGISCGGPLDSKKGVILSPPNLPGWDNIEIVSYLEKRYGGKVAIQNDANACAVAEWKFGAGKGSQNMVFLTFGSGLGAGLILDGKLYTGTNDIAGEAGHIRLSGFGPVGYGKKGSFEGFCSGNGIAALGIILATEKLQMGESVSYCNSKDDLDKITAKLIAEKAYEGNDDAKEVYRICGEKLGSGLSILIDILNPEVIVIGSVFQRAESLLRDAMEKKIEEEALFYARKVCKVVPAALTENIGDVAALSVAAMIE